jgi:cytochrome c oxidase subunit 2
VKIPSQIATLLAGVILTLLSLWYGQNNGLLPVAASEEATQVDGIFKFMMTIATGLFILVEGIVIYCAFKFRRKPGDNTDGPPIEGNVPLEIVWTAIPTVIVFIISVYSFEVYNAMGGLDPMASFDPGPGQIAQVSSNQDEGLLALDPSQGDVALGLGASPEYQGQGKVAPLKVEVTGLQYAWVFNYPDSGITAGELHIPVGRPVRLNIKAQDVLHALWLPEFRIKQDAIPGRETELQFTASRLGDYPVICAELCGPYHGAMNTRLYVESDEDYEGWIQSQVAMQESQRDTIALNSPVETQFLAPHLKEFGVDETIIHQLHAQD